MDGHASNHSKYATVSSTRVLTPLATCGLRSVICKSGNDERARCRAPACQEGCTRPAPKQSFLLALQSEGDHGASQYTPSCECQATALVAHRLANVSCTLPPLLSLTRRLHCQ